MEDKEDQEELINKEELMTLMPLQCCKGLRTAVALSTASLLSYPGGGGNSTVTKITQDDCQAISSNFHFSGMVELPPFPLQMVN